MGGKYQCKRIGANRDLEMTPVRRIGSLEGEIHCTALLDQEALNC